MLRSNIVNSKTYTTKHSKKKQKKHTINCTADKFKIPDHFSKSPRSPRFSLSPYTKVKTADFFSRTFYSFGF